MDYFELISQLDLKNAKIIRDEVVACCPLHEDNNPSFSLNLKTGLWMCFAGCGQGDFATLVSKVKNISREEALKIIDKNIVTKDEITVLKEKIEKLIKGEVKEEEKVTPILEEATLNKFNYDDKEYMKNRGFNDIILGEFEIGKYCDYVTIPIRNENKQLVAVIGRSISGAAAKYIPIMPRYGFEKSTILYGLDKIDNSTRECIIVEGHFDVLKGFQEGFRNCVAIQGSNLSKKQEMLILQNFNMVYIATDNDKPGREALKKIKRQLRGKVLLNEFKYFTNRIKDLGDMNKDMIQYGIDNAKVIK